MQVGINCDMGESFSLYELGEDEGIMPFITEANIACGFHASDPNHMRTTVELATAHRVKTGAHFSLPDQTGFGRRKMKIERAELANILIYQIGALVITRIHDPVDPETAAERCLRAVLEGTTDSINGKELAVRADTVCVHSDTPNAVAVARTVRATLEPYIGQA